VCGAGGNEAMLMLDHLGVETIAINTEPTGLFPHPPEPTRENLQGLCDAVREHQADVGFAQDPDADRLAIVDENGQYIGEEYTLVLSAMELLAEGGIAAANLSTSRMIDDVAAQVGASVVRSPVGEANVASAMREHHAVVGGEGNGGIIWPIISQVRDSVAGIALILQLIAKRKYSLSQAVSSIPQYAIVKQKVELNQGDGQPQVSQMLDKLAEAFANQRVDKQDGVRVDWPDRWVHVRASNTEPILRIIAEARDEETAKQTARLAAKAIGLE